MKSFVCQNVSKYKDIKDSDNYVILDISLNFGSMYKMIITVSDPKGNFGRSGKYLITSMGIKAKAIPKK